jgi:putative ABC transport system permease protein
VSATVESIPELERRPQPAPPIEPSPPRSSAVRDALRGFVGLVGRLLLLLLSIEPLILAALAPLSALLLTLPVAVPDESVIDDTVSRTRLWRNIGRRLFNLAIGISAFVALTVFAVEVIVWLGIRRGALAWGAALMVIYAIDLVILIFIGRVPLAYNFRNLRVRWPITVLTAVVFMAVVGILTVLLAFVNGMYQLTSDSGQPGNVLILADGSTDEVFSNLGYSDVALLERETATLDEDDRPLRRPVRAKRIVNKGEPIPIASREVYCIINRPVENDPTRRQFVQVRGVVDPQMAGEVHGLPIVAGDWFSDAGVRTPAGLQPGSDKDQIEAVLGAGVARELGSKRGVPTLVVGDTFELADRTWVVAGIMNTEGTTFGSEVWAKHDRVSKMFNKLGYSSLVLRVEDDGSREEVAERARQFAAHLRLRFSNPKVNAQTELEYFSKQSENNKTFLYFTLVIAVVMSLGGVFGVMNTMFAAVAQRIKDIGVLRIIGFKRWQVLVSFLLESLLIAGVGGLCGMLLGSLFHGLTATSVLSSGAGGGGKTVILRLVVDANVLMAGAIFTLVMGRLGGLIPAISATRLKLLDALR